MDLFPRQLLKVGALSREKLRIMKAPCQLSRGRNDTVTRTTASSRRTRSQFVCWDSQAQIALDITSITIHIDDCEISSLCQINPFVCENDVGIRSSSDGSFGTAREGSRHCRIWFWAKDRDHRGDPDCKASGRYFPPHQLVNLHQPFCFPGHFFFVEMSSMHVSNSSSNPAFKSNRINSQQCEHSSVHTRNYCCAVNWSTPSHTIHTKSHTVTDNTRTQT